MIPVCQYSDGRAKLERVVIVAYLYMLKSAGTCSTDVANRKAFDRWKLVPRMLNDATLRNVEVSTFESIVIIYDLMLSDRRRFWV